MIIYIDMDNTLLKTFEFSVDYLNFKFNMDLKYPTEYPNSHSGYLVKAGMSDEAAKIARKYLFHNKEYWENIPFEYKAKEVLKSLYEKHDVHIITSAFLSESEECIIAKWNFIKDRLPWFNLKKFAYYHSKFNLFGDLMIEDNWEDELKMFEGIKMLFYRPYNKEANPDVRVYNWEEIGNWIKSH